MPASVPELHHRRRVTPSSNVSVSSATGSNYAYAASNYVSASADVYEQANRIRHAVEYIHRVCNNVNSSTLRIGYNDDPQLLDKCVYYDVLRYMLYLANSDGNIDTTDTRLINIALEKSEEIGFYQDFVRTGDISSSGFGAKILMALDIFMKYDEVFHDHNPDSDADETARIYLCVMRLIGELLLDEEHGVKGDKDVMRIFMSEQERYLDENTTILETQGSYLIADTQDLVEDPTFYHLRFNM